MEISNFVQNPHVEFKVEKVEALFYIIGGAVFRDFNARLQCFIRWQCLV